MPMNEREARSQLRQLMDRHDLQHWKIGFSNTHRRMGVAKLNLKKIEISRRMINFQTNELIIDTMLHEIAHAVDFERRGTSDHSWRWKSVAIEVGANPSRSVDEEQFDSKHNDYKYIYTCEGNCGTETGTYRRLKNLDKKFCSVCWREKHVKNRFVGKQLR